MDIDELRRFWTNIVVTTYWRRWKRSICTDEKIRIDAIIKEQLIQLVLEILIEQGF